jgi:hypothetical protein
MIRLEWASGADTNVTGLLVGQLGQLHTELFEMQRRDFFVEMLGEDVNLILVILTLGPKLNLRQHLVGEAGGHHEAWVTRRATEIDEATFGKDENLLPVRKFDQIGAGLHFGPFVIGKRRNLNLRVKVTDVADNAHRAHRGHMFGGDDVGIAGRGAENVGTRDGFFHRDDFKALHRGLKRADGINLCHHDARAAVAQGLSTALTNIAKARNAGDFTCEHHVGRAADRVDQRFFTAIEVVKLRLGHAVVYVDRGERQFALLCDFIKTVNACGRFFRYTLKIFYSLRQITGLLCNEGLERTLKLNLFFIFWFAKALASFQLRTPKREHRRVAAVIENDVCGRVIAPVEDVADIIPIIGEALTLDREYGNVPRRDCCCRMVLRREDVACRPAHIRAKFRQCFDQHGSLNRHVERTNDTRALERLGRAKFTAQRHQARHFGFGDIDFLASEIGKRDVCDNIICKHVISPALKIAGDAPSRIESRAQS